MNKKKNISIIFAILAAAFYAINMPLSKILLEYISSTLLAGLLYFGAGIGIGLVFLFSRKRIKKEELLSKKDLPYIIGMVILDIIAPILLLYGLTQTNSSTASLLNNFEIVATSLIALIIFKEFISKRMWIAVFLITCSSIFLSVDNIKYISFSWGSLAIILATICWGFENNFTRKISSKNTYEIVTIKGLCCGISSICISLIIKERTFNFIPILLALVLGFVAYGLSISFYIKAQKNLGAAKTSAYYAIAPFIGTLLSVIILHETVGIQYFIGLGLMILGSILVTIDTLLLKHNHMHTHVIIHTHNGLRHSHEITHCHEHNHYLNEEKHSHIHKFNKNQN